VRNAHSNLDRVLASTIQYASLPSTNDDKGSNISHYKGPLCLDSNYELDPDRTGCADSALDDISHKSHTKIFNETASPLPSKPMLYEEAGASIGNVQGFEQEQSNLCQPLWFSFGTAHSFN